MTTRQIWEIDDYNRIIDGTTKALLFTVDTLSDDDPLPIMRKIAAAPAMYEALKLCKAFIDHGPSATRSAARCKEVYDNALAQAEGKP